MERNRQFRWCAGNVPCVRRQFRCAGQHPGLRPGRQPPNLRRIHRRYHAILSSANGLAVTATRVYVANRFTGSILVLRLVPAIARPPRNLPSLPRAAGLAVTTGQPACTSPVPMCRTASWFTTYPATAKPPKNSPSLPRSRWDWRYTPGQPAVYVANPLRDSIWFTTLQATAKPPKNLPSLPRRRLRWRLPPTRVYGASDVAPESILVYDLSGNRQTSEEFTVATTTPEGLAVRIV